MFSSKPFPNEKPGDYIRPGGNEMKKLSAVGLVLTALMLVAGCQTPASDTKTVVSGVNPVKVGDSVVGGFVVTQVDASSTGYIATREFKLAITAKGGLETDSTLVAGLSSLTSGYPTAKHITQTTSTGVPSTAETVAGNKYFSLLRREAMIYGTWTKDVTLTNDYQWTLNGPVFIGGDNKNSATITIEAGTVVNGTSSAIAPGMLVVSRGSKVQADGSAVADTTVPTAIGDVGSVAFGSGYVRPIVFTSMKSAGSRAPGDWGGLVINGNAPINDGDSNGVAVGEGSSGNYGGNLPHDNSGVLKFVRVEFAGVRFTADNELNGVAFQGVGDGTTVDYVQAHMSNDDGVEFFGGTVNATHLVSTGNLDDYLDWTSGWRGAVQFAVLQQYPLSGIDMGFEGDNKENAVTSTPFSHPVLANVTIVGAGYSAGGATDGSATATQNGALFRRGTKVDLWNSILTNFKTGVNETHSSGSAFLASDGTTSGVTYKGVLVEAITAIGSSSGTYPYATGLNGYLASKSAFVTGSNGNYGVNGTSTANAANLPTGYIAALSGGSYSFAFKPTAAASQGTAQTLPTTSVTADYADAAFHFTAASYLGAVDPSGTDWTSGWTTSAAN